MSQDIFDNIDPDSTSGEELADILNLFKDAVASGFSGTARPANLQAGGYWIDTTSGASPDFLWRYKIFDGTNDITVFSININTNTIIISSADDQFSIVKISADTAGALMKLVKRRVANNGQVVAGDTIGDLQFIGREITPGDPLVASVEVIAAETMTGSAQGAYIRFRQIKATTANLVEVMRLINGNLGVGEIAPATTIHATGTGITSGRNADDAVGAKLIRKKRRTSGTGATQNNDVISQDITLSTDDATADLEVFRREVKASQAHTATAGGVRVAWSITKTGAATLTEKIIIQDVNLLLKEAVSIEALVLEQQTVATAATIGNLSAAKAIVLLTGSTATTIQGIDATGLTKTILVHNASTAEITFANENGTATATNRMSLPSSRDIKIKARESVELFYSTSETRWKLKSGSGGGGGAMIVSAVQSLAASAEITLSDDQRQRAKIKSTGGEVVVTLPNGTVDGQEVYVQGDDKDNYCVIANGGNVISNGDTYFYTGTLKLYIWDAILTSWVQAS